MAMNKKGEPEGLLKEKVADQSEEMAKAADQNTVATEAAKGAGARGRASFEQVDKAAGAISAHSADGENGKEAWHKKKLEQLASERIEATASTNQHDLPTGAHAGASTPNQHDLPTGAHAGASSPSKSAALDGKQPTSLAQTEESEVDGILDDKVNRVTRRFHQKQQR
jgi:hypothetical protein